MSDFKSDVEVFSFEERSDVFSLFDFAGCTNNGRYFEPPVNLFDLLRLLNRGLHHSSAVMAKLNILKVTFRPTELLSRAEFEKLAFN